MLVEKINKQYDATLILAELEQFEKKYCWSEIKPLASSFAVTSRDGTTTDGNKPFIGDETEFKMLELYNGSYISQVINDLNISYGRIRFLKLQPGYIMKIHYDPSVRYHIPITTNLHCGFLDEELYSYTMPELGRLYKLNATNFHTAFNCSRHEDRIHLVIVEAY